MSSVKPPRDNVSPNVEVVFTNTSDSFGELSLEDFTFDSCNKNEKVFQFEQHLYTPGNGEICTKYIPLSASSVLRHPYFNYPGVKDPGIEDALLRPEPMVIYPDDGQELYLAKCKETNVSPIRKFYNGLLEEKVNLKYYGISPMGFRPLAMSLKNNTYVKILDLTDNWISEDGCFHLGEMLIENITLQKLTLYGCRIGPEGARRLFAYLHLNHSLSEIDLTKNCLGDDGFAHLAKAIFLGSAIKNINISYNDITAKSVLYLADVFETHNKLTHLNLSWNAILSPNAVFSLCSKLSENKLFEELNLSWTSLSGLRVGKAIKILLSNPNIKNLNLSNNKLSTVAIKQIADGLTNSRSLNCLNLSYNPLTPKDAFILLLCMKERKVKLHNLLLENVFVTTEFLELRREIMSLKYRKNAVITWGGLIEKFTPTSGDMREIVLNRADAICKKSKKHVDIALVILNIHKQNQAYMGMKEFARAIKSNGVILDEGLLEELSNCFVGPSDGTGKTINLADLVDYLHRKWPERQLPPTPKTETEIVSKKVKKTK